MNTDLVSIICVTRNAALYLENCLESIFAQAYQNIQLIIVDGESTDGTVEILRKWNHKIDYWVSEADRGIYDAMNKAIKHIKGEWVYFIGSDDCLLSGFSDFVCNELVDRHTVYYSNVIYKGAKDRGQLTPYQQLKNGLYHQSIIYPKTVFDKYLYNEKYKISADSYLNYQIFHDDTFRIEYRDYTVAIFNHTGLSSAQFDKELYKDLPRIAFNYFGLSIYLRYMLRRIKRKIKGSPNW